MLKDGVRRDLVEHPLQSGSPRLDEVAIEAADGLLLRRRRYHDAGVVVV